MSRKTAGTKNDRKAAAPVILNPSIIARLCMITTLKFGGYEIGNLRLGKRQTASQPNLYDLVDIGL